MLIYWYGISQFGTIIIPIVYFLTGLTDTFWYFVLPFSVWLYTIRSWYVSIKTSSVFIGQLLVKFAFPDFLLHVKSISLRSERNHRKRKQLDGNSDYSGRMSDGPEDQIKDRRRSSSDTKMRIDQQVWWIRAFRSSWENIGYHLWILARSYLSHHYHPRLFIFELCTAERYSLWN